MTVTLLITSISLFNYFIDGSNQFFHKKSFENKLTTLLLNNKKILICNNFNDRSLKRSLLEKITIKPETLIFGSSRTMPLNKELFAEDKFFNASVTAATLPDDVALYYIYQKHNGQPRKVIIGLDQWLLNESTVDTLWKTTFLSEFNAGQTLISADKKVKSTSFEKISGFIEKYSQLISPYYLKSSLKKNQFLSQFSNYKATVDNVIIDPTFEDSSHYPNCNIQLPDGTHLTSVNDEATSATQADFVSAVDIRRSSSPIKFSEENRKLFENFITYLLKKNIEVTFYLPPYEPVAYGEIKKDPNYKLVVEAEKYFRQIASEYHIKVIGSYNPEQMNLHANDFIDDVHLKKRGIEKVFKT